MANAQKDLEADDWVDETANRVKDFFSDKIFDSPSAYWAHAKANLGFDYVAIRSKNHLDSYDGIKLVNYLRITAREGVADPKAFLAALSFGTAAPWRSDEFLKPVLEDDPFLFAGDNENDDAWSDDEGSLLAPPDAAKVRENVDALDRDQVISKLRQKENALLETKMELANLKDTIAKLQAFSHQVLIGKEDESSTDSDGDSSSEEDEDGGYFGAYAHHSIHAQMLKDAVRTDGYRDFIYKNPHLFKDKIVMDVGCGTGILSMFAAKAGAKKVFAIDKSGIINKAKLIAQENGFTNIVFINKKSELLTEKDLEGHTEVDIIISEWMGYCLLFECMLPSVLVVRDKFCKKGLVFPDRAKMFISAWSDAQVRHDRVDYWSEVYGFKMNPMKEGVLREPKIDVLPDAAVATSTFMLKDFDCNTVKIEELDYTTDFKLVVDQERSTIDGFVVHFDIDFLKDCTSPVTFSTGPKVQDTHWMQTIFFSKASVAVAGGDVIEGKFSCKRGSIYHRDLELEVAYRVVGKTETEVLKFVLN